MSLRVNYSRYIVDCFAVHVYVCVRLLHMINTYRHVRITFEAEECEILNFHCVMRNHSIRFNLKCDSYRNTRRKIHNSQCAKKNPIKTQPRFINNIVSSQIKYKMLHLHKHVYIRPGHLDTTYMVYTSNRRDLESGFRRGHSFENQGALGQAEIPKTLISCNFCLVGPLGMTQSGGADSLGELLVQNNLPFPRYRKNYEKRCVEMPSS